MPGTRFWTIFAVGLVTACAPARVVTTPAPVPVAGSQIRYAITPDTANFFAGRLISLDADRLVIERVVPGTAEGRWAADSLATESIARLQVRIGRRSNAGRGALIGAVVGVAAGLGCAFEDPSWGWSPPSTGECLALSIPGGIFTGALIGAFVHTDVWAPAPLPGPTPKLPPAPPLVSSATVGFGVRLPVRIVLP